MSVTDVATHFGGDKECCLQANLQKLDRRGFYQENKQLSVSNKVLNLVLTDLGLESFSGPRKVS